MEFFFPINTVIAMIAVIFMILWTLRP